MDFAASKVLGLLSTSGTLLMMALLIGIFLLWFGDHWRAGRTLLTLVILVLAVAIVSPMQPWLTAELENRFPGQPSLPDKIDGIIILGGMIKPNISKARNRASLNDAAERLLEGAHLAAQHPEAKVLFTGGSADPWNPSAREADWAIDILKQMGIGEDRLVVEDKARNTYENALFSRQILPAKPGERWVLVTSAMHLPRAVGVFRQVGWSVIPWPTNYLTGGDEDWANEDLPLTRLYRLSRALHEWIGLIYYRLRGWTPTLFPGPESVIQ